MNIRSVANLAISLFLRNPRSYLQLELTPMSTKAVFTEGTLLVSPLLHICFFERKKKNVRANGFSVSQNVCCLFQRLLGGCKTFPCAVWAPPSGGAMGFRGVGRALVCCTTSPCIASLSLAARGGAVQAGTMDRDMGQGHRVSTHPLG